jgi:nucleotide-binding universal stress UspA family protein
MFTNILLPTDGSKLSLKAVKAGVALAKLLGARVTGCYVFEPYQPYYFGDYIPPDLPTPKEMENQARAAGAKALEAIKREASAAGVPYAGSVIKAAAPYDGIIKAARKARCDLIFMASHGRRGIAGVLLGSETHKVLTHSKIPVTVYR